MTTKKTVKKIRGVFERPMSSGIWWISYQRLGVRKREKVGRKSDALDLYRVRKSEILSGIKLPQNIKSAQVIFQALADSALVYSAAHHKDTRNVAQRITTLCDKFGARVANDILPEHIDVWLAANTKTPATANRYRAAMSLCFSLGIRNGKVRDNPARLVHLRPENNGRIRQLTAAEEGRLRAAIEARFPHHLPELVISLKSGMRLSEQYALRWTDIDFETNEIDVKKTKNNVPRQIPMSPEVRASFETLRAGEPVNSKARVFKIKEAKSWFKPALEDAGIEEYHWHDNRHTFCSRLGKQKAHIKTIMQLSGHRTIQMAARYTHMDSETLADEVAKLG